MIIGSKDELKTKKIIRVMTHVFYKVREKGKIVEF
jgi:hypothetical protein